jgi:hypothetical protein
MSVVRDALLASLSDPSFMERELRAGLSPFLMPPGEHAMELRLVDVEDREAVLAELKGGSEAPLVLSAFADIEDAAHAHRVAQELWDAGFDERSRYRVPRPLALIEGDGLLVSEGTPGIPLVKLVDRRATEAVRQVNETGSWLAMLHTSDVRVGSPWLPWRSVEALSVHLRARRRVVDAHREAFRDMVKRLAPLAGRAGKWTWVQTHGRFRPDRVMAAPRMLAVDDFVRSCPGDPARDVAEFVFHLRRRAAFTEGIRADALEPAFLDGYLAHASDEHLDNVSFYAGCAILTSMVADAPSLSVDMQAWIEWHQAEFDRWVMPSPIHVLMPTA